MTKEERFEKYHNSLRHELNTAYWHFTAWKCLRKLGRTYLDELNQAPAFFGLTIEAHFAETLILLSKFFERRKKREKEKKLNIRLFLDFIANNLDIFSNQAFELRMRRQGKYDDRTMRSHTEITLEKVNEHRKKVNDLPAGNIKQWRNNLLAHTATEVALQKVDIPKRYPVREKQIDQVIDTLHDILNVYWAAYVSSTWLKELPSIEYGIQRVVEAIRFEREEHLKKYRAQPSNR